MSSSSLACRQCGEPIKFDAKHVSQRTGKKIPLDIETNEPHDCPDGEIGNRGFTYGDKRDSAQAIAQYQQPQRHTTNVTKAVETKSTLMQITKVKFIPLDKDTGLPHQWQQSLA